jgi:tRNA (guanine-N7-)-methyltransferase
VRIECGYFLEYLLPPHAAQALHIYFPDPWPKKKHRTYRLINVRFPTLAAQALPQGGWVHLRTDDADYFEQMTEVFSRSRLFECQETPRELATLATDFERDFVASGRPIQRVSYQLTGR